MIYLSYESIYMFVRVMMIQNDMMMMVDAKEKQYQRRKKVGQDMLIALYLMCIRTKVYILKLIWTFI